ncbi:MAG: HlyD family secretion protein, partial [Ruminococcus sp.]|nr:HlyD family secretion protein [Ruminococcus sp.]
VDRYNEQIIEEKVTPSQVENAKTESDKAYSALNSVVSAYLSDIRSQILLIENQLISDSENEELQKALANYNALKNAVEQSSELSSEDESINVAYEQYISQYQTLYDDYTAKSEEYSRLYNAYTAQNSKVQIVEADITNAENAYNTAIIDRDALKNSYISQIENKISTLNEEIKSLESSKKNLEVSLKNVKDLETYEKLSSDKLKNEAIITVNSEIDSLNDNIISMQSQMAELEETIRNSEIKASVDGTVTLINNLSTGDIVQAGTSLCSIIPIGDDLKVNLYIPESEVAKVAVGQKTEYNFDAIPYNEYGKVTGEIISISADSIANESSGMKYYIAQASMSQTSLTNKDGNVREIRNGMLLEAKSISGSKKVITWLLEKLNFID